MDSWTTKAVQESLTTNPQSEVSLRFFTTAHIKQELQASQQPSNSGSAPATQQPQGPATDKKE
jgi:hypothetical protein